jgi:hypothetical protein
MLQLGNIPSELWMYVTGSEMSCWALMRVGIESRPAHASLGQLAIDLFTEVERRFHCFPRRSPALTFASAAERID